MNLDSYNNIGIASIGIEAVLSKSIKLSTAKVLLILPIIANRDLTSYLGRSTTQVKSVEKLVAEKISFFSNFNKVYYDSLAQSLNAIQFLIEKKKIRFVDGSLLKKDQFIYSSTMGNRARRIVHASSNISKLLDEDSMNLYLNFRIEL